MIFNGFSKLSMGELFHFDCHFLTLATILLPGIRLPEKSIAKTVTMSLSRSFDLLYCLPGLSLKIFLDRV